MFRPILLAWCIAVPMVLTGCVGTWDTITSQRMRREPFETAKRMFVPEDPVTVLLADPPRTGDERAAAMRRLEEPILNEGTQHDQDAIIGVLEQAAVWDPSPVVRMEAVQALGRFEDARVTNILMAAYQNAHGRKPSDSEPSENSGVIHATGVGTSAGRQPVRAAITDPFPLSGPTGFPPGWVSAIRCRTAEALGETSSPEAAKFLATVAGGAGDDVTIEGNEDRDIRLAAIRGLGNCRQPEAVYALAQVLQTEAEHKDTAVIGRTHQGLVRLTGKKLPPDPQVWNEVVQAGVVVAPEPTWIEDAIQQVIFWE